LHLLPPSGSEPAGNNWEAGNRCCPQSQHCLTAGMNLVQKYPPCPDASSLYPSLCPCWIVILEKSQHASCAQSVGMWIDLARVAFVSEETSVLEATYTCDSITRVLCLRLDFGVGGSGGGSQQIRSSQLHQTRQTKVSNGEKAGKDFNQHLEDGDQAFQPIFGVLT
jgi:hypothetical protein